MKHVLFLSGPVGAGKTTLGSALAAALDGSFVDGDDYAAPDRPWYASALTTSRNIAAELRRLLARHDLVVVAYPLRCTGWIYFRRTVEAEGARPLFVTLRAAYPATVAPDRGRGFSPAEHRRIREMIAEGYADRPFSDRVLNTDRATFPETLADLRRVVADLLTGA